MNNGHKTQQPSVPSITSEAVGSSDVLFDEALPDEVIDEFPEDVEAAPLTLVAAEGGDRLDRWLAGQLSDRSRSEIQRWIEAGLVSASSRLLKASHRLTAGDKITVVIPASEDYTVEPEPIPLDVLYEDADLLVINKPAGMVVHPAAGNWHGTLVNAVLYHCPDLEGVGGARRPGIVHRLDKDTSGVILVAKNDAAHRDLQAQFKARQVRKTYWALVYGLLSPAQGEITAPIGRDPRDRKRMAVVSANHTKDAQSGGRPATTRYETLNSYRMPETGERLSWLACHPLTGRTHQIRVHLAYIKHPIVGDEVYCTRRKTAVRCPRQFLHAERISFRLPSAGEEVEFSAPLAEDLRSVLDMLAAKG
jgi:23S rRNA pseudouridine1911/1915/1917 synthase